MKLKNILLVVNDVEKSKKFYHELFGLEVILNSDGNIIMTEGLVLQEKKIWQQCLNRKVVQENNSCELYFEEADIEKFVEKLDRLYPEIRYVTPLASYSWGKKIVRIYDPDNNLIEVGTPV